MTTSPVTDIATGTCGTAERRYDWRHAAAVGVLATVASALPAGYNGDEDYFDQLATPPGSPPGWAFAPVWAVNNALTLWSNLRVANLPEHTEGRRAALISEAASWTLFASFSGLYFGLRSPVLGAVDTAAGLATTVHGVVSTARVDRRAAWALVPRLLWLGFATYVSVGTALRNPDDLFGYRPRRSRR
ncbi:MAG TPA: TspO/MBR family protein [Pseudonocardia sp.]|nr:TspO/MBR family protein [Pseudonocardia sp.]